MHLSRSTSPAPERSVLKIQDFPDAVSANKKIDPDKSTLISIFRDEIFFCNAFFDYYRSIGIEQFIILDDGSEDGTREYLRKQEDCVLLTSSYRYGTHIKYYDRDGIVNDQRFGVFFKIAAPSTLIGGQYCLYVDADEFIILPNNSMNIREIFKDLKNCGSRSLLSTVVEFFPSDFNGLTAGANINNFQDLLDQYGYFEAQPLIVPEPGVRPKRRTPTKSMQLFRRFNITHKPEPRGWLDLRAFFRKPRVRHSPWYKTPIICADDTFGLRSTHDPTEWAADDRYLTIAHFVFTAQFREKIERAQKWRSHVQGADKYNYYEKLYDSMKRDRISFITENSQKYRGPDQLIECGLMRW